MKNATLFILFFLSTSILVGQEITIGPKVGFQINNWSTNFDNIKSRISGHFGAFGTYSITENLKGRGEISFFNMGPTSVSTSNPSRISLNYITISLLGEYSLLEGDLSIHSGFQPGVFLSGKTVVKEGNNQGSFNSNDLFKAIDIAFLLGGEYKVHEKASVGLRLQIGLNNILTNADGDGDISKNQLFQIYAVAPLLSF